MKNTPTWNAGLMTAVAVAMGLTAAANAETSIKLSDAPQAVQAAITKETGKPVKMLDKEEDGGKTLYEADYDMKGAKCSVKVDEAGTVVERETAVKHKDLPAAVKQAVKAKYPKAKVKSAEKVEAGGETYFELMVMPQGKDAAMREVKVSADGKISADAEAVDEADEAGGKPEMNEKGEAGEKGEMDEKGEAGEKPEMNEKGEKGQKGEMNEKDEQGEHAD